MFGLDGELHTSGIRQCLGSNRHRPQASAEGVFRVAGSRTGESFVYDTLHALFGVSMFDRVGAVPGVGRRQGGDAEGVVEWAEEYQRVAEAAGEFHRLGHFLDLDESQFAADLRRVLEFPPRLGLDLAGQIHDLP